MSKIALVLLCLLPTLAVAAPTTIWDLDSRQPTNKKDVAVVTLHPHADTSTPMTYADAAIAIDTKVQPGEWIIDNLWPVKEAADLQARAKKRGAVLVQWNEVVVGSIIGVTPNKDGVRVTKGYITSLKVDLTNRSPYVLRATKLVFTSCNPIGTVTFTKPVVIGAKATQRVSVTLGPGSITHRERFIACPDTGGWSEEVQVSFVP